MYHIKQYIVAQVSNSTLSNMLEDRYMKMKDTLVLIHNTRAHTP